MESNIYDLTEPQKSIWLIEQYYPNTTINTISGTLIMEEEINLEILKRAIYIFVEKNDSFRTRIIIKDGEPKQYVTKILKFEIEEVILSNREELKKLENKIVEDPFELINCDLFKFTIIRFKDGTGGFNAKVHHIISDAWTMSLLINEITEIYTALSSDYEVESQLYPSYLQYIDSNKEYKNSEKYLKDEKYWENTFDTMPENSYIANYKNKTENLEAKRREYVLDEDIIDRIKVFCQNDKTSIYTFLMSVYSLYLSRVSGNKNPIIGTPILNRKNYREKNTTGMFVSTIPNKIHINNELRFKEFISEVTKIQREIFKHQQYGYEKILKSIREKYNIKKQLYDIVLSYQNARDNSKQSKLLYHTKWIFNNYLANSLWINIYDMDNTEELKIFYDYQICKFCETDIDNIHKRILYIMKQILENEEIILNDIEVITPEEKNKLLFEFNNTKTEYQADKTIKELFEEQVNKSPEKIAIVYEDNQMTYKQLNEKANQLAYYLRINKKIKSNDIIGIMVNRSIEMIIGILAIIKAGGAYLPIDPDYPKERITYMLEDSNTKTVLVNNFTYNIVSSNIRMIDISLDSDIYKYQKNDNLDNINVQDDLLYVIYTSGSTGKPKGVMLTHKNINNYINGLKKVIDFSENKTIVSVTTICFDIFVTEVWAGLLNGLKIVLANENEQNMPIKLNELCIKHHVDIIQTTPSRYNILLNSNNYKFLENVKDILVGGEALGEILLSKMRSVTKANIYNMYGPTETAVWSTIKNVTETNEITIGKPIINTQIYILDENKKLLPPDIPGELYIGGDGVSKGYLNNKELTNEKFIKTSFSSTKIYNTNDMAYVKENGELVYLGRTDFQVKVNGYRVELEEVENSILKFDRISSCIVIVKKDIRGRDNIYAYFEAKEKIDINKLRKNLQQQLPQYMVPQYFLQLDNLPYTPNGKIDRKRLPDIHIERKTKLNKAETQIEKKLEKIIRNLLNLSNIDFSEDLLSLGADSLTAISLASEINKEFDIDITIKEIMETKSLEELSEVISKKPKNSKDNKISSIEKKEHYCVSSAQSRIYLANEMSNKIVYNMPGKICIEGNLNVKKLENTFKLLIDRHESLRTYFEVLKNGQIVQKIEDNIEFKLEVTKCNKNDLNNKINEFVQPFNLKKAPLFRAELLQIQQKEFVLLFDMHHIISDGTSIKIIIRELQDIYNDKNLENISITYKDYANWEKENLEKGNFKKQEEFWVNQFNDEVPLLNIPFDFEKPEINSFKGSSISESISEELNKSIIGLSKKYDTTPYIILLCVYYLILIRYTNQDDIVIATPIINRTSKELKNVIGMFVNNIPIRIKSNNQMKFSELVKEVKNIALKCFDNQLYPTDKLIQKLNMQTGEKSLFSTMFVYQNDNDFSIKLNNVKVNVEIINTNISKFDLTLEIREINKKFNIRIEYCTDLFKKETIEYLKEHYINALKDVIKEPNKVLADINIMSEEEENKILNYFNNTKTIYKDNKSIQEIFEENAKKNPNSVALVFEDKKVTYSEINKKANSLATHLRNKGIQNNAIVGLSTKRSEVLIISLLAILKAGGAYLPIDPILPRDRKEYMLEVSGCQIMLVDNDLDTNFKIQTINVEDSRIYKNNTENLSNINNENDLFAVIFTSGSTGKPKCVGLTRKRIK